jgi:N-acetylglutamate synthase-like GNAT family acetyltransferase
MNSSPTNPTIRPYTPADLEPCRALWVALTEHHRTLYGEPAIGGAQPGLYFDAHLERVGAERLWVAEADGTVCGLVGLIVRGEEAEVEPIVVSVTHRGCGIGQRLLARARQEAEALQVRFLCVRPVARNAEAMAFFYGAGFQFLGQVELFMDLSSSSERIWEDGVTIHGHPFKY